MIPRTTSPSGERTRPGSPTARSSRTWSSAARSSRSSASRRSASVSHSAAAPRCTSSTSTRARYSEDIDLVQVAPEPIGDTFDAVRAVLDRGWASRGATSRRAGSTSSTGSRRRTSPRRRCGSRSRSTPASTSPSTATCRIASRSSREWWSGKRRRHDLLLDELLGTKLRALYQRKKGRDLFDLWFALANGAASAERVVSCFDRYLREEGRRVTRAAFEENLAGKLTDAQFRAT